MALDTPTRRMNAKQRRRGQDIAPFYSNDLLMASAGRYAMKASPSATKAGPPGRDRHREQPGGPFLYQTPRHSVTITAQVTKKQNVTNSSQDAPRFEGS
jgi:hypothetical protein